MNKLSLRSTLILLCFFHCNLFAQSYEASHLHFDKDIYLPGETIWFKAYLYNGSESSTLSTNFYAAIYDTSGKLLQQKQYPIIDGTANGDFTLSDSITTGQLQFVAFTKGMQLNDSNNIYKKIITILTKDAISKNQQNVTSNDIRLQFFAEGGNAIEAMPNYYAYRAWHSDGSPANIQGLIREQGSNTDIDSFYTNELGMGKIQFTPQPGKTYQAIWKSADEKTMFTIIPAAIPVGVLLHAEQSDNMLYFSVAKNSDASNFNTMYIVAKMATLQVYEATLHLNDLFKIVNKIPLDSLPNGLVQLTLLDSNKMPLQERMIIINKKNGLLNLTVAEKNTAAKAKNVIKLNISDTLIYNLSASIADINFFNKTNTTINNQLWFNENIRGITVQVKQALQTNDVNNIDLILLTHGWRKYNNNLPDLLKADNYLTIATNKKEKKYILSSREKLNLIIKDAYTGNQFYDIEQTSQSNFVKPGLVFYDSAKVYYKITRSGEIENYLIPKREELYIFPKFINKAEAENHKKLPDVINNNAIDTFIQDYSNTPKKFNDLQTIKTVVVKSKKYGNPTTLRILELDDKYTSGMFSGIGRGYQFNILDDPNNEAFSNIFSYLTSRVPGLVKKSGNWGIERANEFLIFSFFFK